MANAAADALNTAYGFAIPSNPQTVIDHYLPVVSS